MLNQYTVAYIRAAFEDEKSIEKQVNDIEEYCDGNNIISFGFYEEIAKEITKEMIEFLKSSCKDKNALILVASLCILSDDMNKVKDVIAEFKAQGIEIRSLNQWEMQVLRMQEQTSADG